MLLTQSLSPALCAELPYLRSLGIGALILEGLFDKEASPLNLTATGERFGALAQIKHLIAESNKAGEQRTSFCQTDCICRLQTFSCNGLMINEVFLGPAGLKVVLDFCALDVSGPEDVAGNAHEPSDLSAAVHVKTYSLVMLMNM